MFKNSRYISFITFLWMVPFQPYGQVKKDTAFLHRAFENGSYHAIFLANKNSPFHDEVSEGFKIDTFTYNSFVRDLKDSGNSIRNFEINFNQDWYSLHQYKQKYYAYLPSEPYVNSYIRITDSTVILNDFNDGLIPALIQKLEWLDAKTLKIHTAAVYKEYSVLIFHFLNVARDLSVIEFPYKDKKIRFRLSASKDRLKKYPIIVNYCPDARVHEWEFEKPKFEALLK
jgi:hypothetical protein